MKRFLAVCVVAVVAISLSGCNRGWTCWFNRGAACDTCGTTTVLDGTLAPPGQLPEPIN